MTNTSGYINSQSKQDITVCHIAKVKSATSAHYLAHVISFCVCYLHMQMQTLCRAVKISITISYSTSVKNFYRGLTEVFIPSPFRDNVH